MDVSKKSVLNNVAINDKIKLRKGGHIVGFTYFYQRKSVDKFKWLYC